MQHLTAFSKSPSGTSNSSLHYFATDGEVQIIKSAYSILRVAVIAYIICNECGQGKESEALFSKLKRNAPQPRLEKTSKPYHMPRIRTQYSKNAVPSDSTASFDLFEHPGTNTCFCTTNIRQIALSLLAIVRCRGYLNFQ